MNPFTRRASSALAAVQTAQSGQISRASYTMPSGSTIAQLPTAIATAFGINTISDRVTRADAMSVPAMRRARSIIAGTIATLPLVAIRTNPAGELERLDRPLLTQPCTNTTRAWVIAQTVDALLFYGIAWWRVVDRDVTGYPHSVEVIAGDRVHVDVTEGRVYIDGKPVDHRDVIRFDGLDDGILADGRALRTTLLLEDAVRRHATGLPPADILRLAEGAAELDDDDVVELLDAWADARQTRATAYLNRSIEYQAVGVDPRAGQLAEARSYQAAEIARLCNLDAEALDAPGGNSMTYANVESKRRERLDTTLMPFMVTIEQRLSLGDVTPRGTVVKFDPWHWLRTDTAGLITAASDAIAAGVMTVNEVRQDWLDRSPLPETAPAPTPEDI